MGFHYRPWSLPSVGTPACLWDPDEELAHPKLVWVRASSRVFSVGILGLLQLPVMMRAFLRMYFCTKRDERSTIPSYTDQFTALFSLWEFGSLAESGTILRQKQSGHHKHAMAILDLLISNTCIPTHPYTIVPFLRPKSCLTPYFDGNGDVKSWVFLYSGQFHSALFFYLLSLVCISYFYTFLFLWGQC